MVYGALLGVLLPYIVGKWWYGSQRYTKEKVLVASAGNIFREYKEDITDGGIINALSAGVEFKDMLKGPRAEAGLAKLEKKVLAEGSILVPETRKTLSQMDDSTRRKALALLWAYLGRIDLEDATLNGGKIWPFCVSENQSANEYLFLCREIRGSSNCPLSERSIYSHFPRLW